jgi:hypothetical protein
VHAAGAAHFAGAVAQALPRRFEQRLDAPEQPGAEAEAALVAVVEEDCSAPQLGVVTVGDAGDVEAVAQHEEWEQRERGVLDGV